MTSHLWWYLYKSRAGKQPPDIPPIHLKIDNSFIWHAYRSLKGVSVVSGWYYYSAQQHSLSQTKVLFPAVSILRQATL